MTEILRIKLSDFFRLFPPTHVLGTTYTLSLAFFESVVFPHIDKTNLHKCIIICDRIGFQRAISEASALKAATTFYMPITAPTTRKFHPKVWLMANKDQIALLVGSGNLTQSGFMENLEFFDVIQFSKDNTNKTLVNDVIIFLNGLRNLWSGISKSSTLVLDTFGEMINLLKYSIEGTANQDDGDIRFLTSFHGPFKSLFGQYAKDCHLFIASPYFGGSVEGISILQRAITPIRTEIFPALHPDGSVDVPIKEALSLPNTTVSSLKLAMTTGRFPHFKLYGFSGTRGKNVWLFNGSINCTKAALESENIEAGILRRIPSEILGSYFQDSKKELLGTPLSRFKASNGNWFVFWATNLGDIIELVAAASASVNLPLKEAVLSLHIGTNRFDVRKDTLFDYGENAEISWKLFPKLKLTPGSVCLLELLAKDQKGRSVVGTTFVNDLLALSSSPLHRSAWRAALALIEEESAPDYYDIVAVFSLLNDVFASSEIEKSKMEEIRAGKESCPQDDETDKDRIPLWPPVSLVDNSFGPFDGRRVSNVYWFQKILSTLLSPKENLKEPNAPRTEGIDDEGEEGKVTPDAIPKEVKSVYEKTWKHSITAFESLERKLNSLVVYDKIAPKIIPVALAILLSTLALKKVALRISKGELELPRNSGLLERFICILYSDREQPEDYSPSSNCRYKFRIFPPVAEDLTQAFQIMPHEDLSSVIFCIFAYLKAVSSGGGRGLFSINNWLSFRNILGGSINHISADMEYIEHICERYFIDEEEGMTWDKVTASIKALDEVDWQSHPGFREIITLKEVADQTDESRIGLLSPYLRVNIRGYLSNIKKGVKPFHRVDRFVEFCDIQGCPKFYIIDPIKAKLKDLMPVICSGCGCVLVPDKLYDAFERLNNGKVS